jgi:hypothetical protein
MAVAFVTVLSKRIRALGIAAGGRSRVSWL